MDFATAVEIIGMFYTLYGNSMVIMTEYVRIFSNITVTWHDIRSPEIGHDQPLDGASRFLVDHPTNNIQPWHPGGRSSQDWGWKNPGISGPKIVTKKVMEVCRALYCRL